MKFIYKNWLPIGMLIALFVVIFLNIETKKEESISRQIQALNGNSSAQCYLYEQEIAIENDDISVVGINREYVEITITSAGLATGQHFILPFQADINKADFVGVSQEGFVNVVATAKIKGKIWQEQRLYQIKGDKLFVGYQEVFVPRYRNDNGIYLYEDINKLKFETDEFFLNLVECSDINKSVF